MIRRWAIPMLLCIAASTAWADPPEDPADLPAGAVVDEVDDEPAETVDQQLQGLIEAIENAETPAHAVDAYAQAGRIRRGDLGINQAYMKKMLGFGQIQSAVYAARWLLKHDETDGVAWAVLAYFEVSRSHMPQALAAAVRAAEQLPDDPGVMHNLGLLAAWYESQDDPRGVSIEAARAVRDRIDAWLEADAFAGIYQTVADNVAVFNEDLAALNDELDQVADTMDAVRDEAEFIQEEIDALEYEIYALQRELDTIRYRIYICRVRAGQRDVIIADKRQTVRRLQAKATLTDAEQRQLDRLLWELDIAENRRGRLADVGRLGDLRDQADELRDEIHDLLMERASAINEIRRLERDFADLKLDRRDVEREADGVRRERDGYLGELFRYEQWELPLIDGQRIDPAAARRQAQRSVSQGAEPELVDEPTQKLRMARQYLRTGMDDRAREILADIVETAPASDAAVEAQELLDELIEPVPE